MRRVALALVAVAGLSLAAAPEAKAQFALSIGNPYGYGMSNYGLGGYGLGGYGLGAAPLSVYSSGYSGYGYGVAPYTSVYSSGYYGAPVAPFYGVRSYGYGYPAYGYGRGYYRRGWRRW